MANDSHDTGADPDAKSVDQDEAATPEVDREVDPFPADPWELEPGSVSSIGDYLKKQRQLRGISQEELCKLTRIPSRSLERLEAGAFDTLDDGFVRGFVRTVADALGLDPDDTLARMSAEPEPEAARSLHAPSPGLLRVGILVAAVALVLVSVGLVRTALDALPGGQQASPLIVRTDPVRALAEASGASVIDTTEVLVPIPPRQDVQPEAPADPSAPVMRADAPTEAEAADEVTAP
ncbi:MAG: helix-turn-helix transcriptional regulator [Myxococcota bacterium]|nr:helix-turn-helix transcriptional regulator [Myxococcota bacterium]